MVIYLHVFWQRPCLLFPSEYIIMHKQNLKCFTQTAIIQVKAYMYICRFIVAAFPINSTKSFRSQLTFALGGRLLPVRLLSKMDTRAAGTKKLGVQPAVPKPQPLCTTCN